MNKNDIIEEKAVMSLQILLVIIAICCKQTVFKYLDDLKIVIKLINILRALNYIWTSIHRLRPLINLQFQVLSNRRCETGNHIITHWFARELECDIKQDVHMLFWIVIQFLTYLMMSLFILMFVQVLQDWPTLTALWDQTTGQSKRNYSIVRISSVWHHFHVQLPIRKRIYVNDSRHFFPIFTYRCDHLIHLSFSNHN